MFYSGNKQNNEELIHPILNDIRYEYFNKCTNTNDTNDK